jgi:TorA maturation chaperone TorD
VSTPAPPSSGTSVPASAQAAPISFASANEGEELQRAEIYGLLARLWLAPPDADLFKQFAVAVTQAPTQGGFLEAPWHDLVLAMRSSNEAAAKQEFDTLFVSVGRPEVFLYASAHLAGALNERPLVALRSDLEALGLTRDPSLHEQGMTEDHLSFLMEVMRYLIAGDDLAVCNLERQRQIFRIHLQPWVAEPFCDAVQAHASAKLYAALALFTRAFMQVETQGFDMIE